MRVKLFYEKIPETETRTGDLSLDGSKICYGTEAMDKYEKQPKNLLKQIDTVLSLTAEGLTILATRYQKIDGNLMKKTKAIDWTTSTALVERKETVLAKIEEQIDEAPKQAIEAKNQMSRTLLYMKND